MNLITALFTPSVESASRGLTKAMATFEKAQAAHTTKAAKYAALKQEAQVLVIRAQEAVTEQQEAADRAARIGAKLADLLA